ncbi:helix-turn-helix transcriptional regulator [Cohnella cholangitidis]|uniref:Helix-turn-helix domain-containing protein n=1 Tax=Cohnella cholangitidis TaxID=2598458 RepID=A0A7G5C3A0_9BACL|nr:AraC family transcriptional regulator [Cohnella cholangitidis]QMV43684.1 helix-turn-helix domain-containing protein [Cohnella cholangitidis]
MRFVKTDIRKPLEFLSAGQFHSPIPWTHSRRTIDSYEIIVGVRGTMYIEQGEERYAVIPGSVLLLPPGLPHSGYRPSDGELIFYWFHYLSHGSLQFSDDDQREQDRKLRQSNEFLSSLSESLYLPLFFQLSSIERINVLFQQLQHLANSKLHYRRALHYAVTSIVLELAEQAESANTHEVRYKPDPLVASIVEWIRVHAEEPLTVNFIAEKYGYNRDYLSRLFKRTMGMNLQEYIHVQKMAKAKSLLTSTNRTVKQIAFDIGMADEKYFIRLFRKYEHLTPTGYRNAYYRKHLNIR